MREEKIVLCETCDGTGYLPKKTKIDFHHNIYDEFIETCPTCRGIGRRLEIIEKTFIVLDEEQLKRKTLYG